MLIAGVGDGGQTKAAEKARRDEIEAEKKRIREVNITAHHKIIQVCMQHIITVLAAAAMTTAAVFNF